MWPSQIFLYKTLEKCKYGSFRTFLWELRMNPIDKIFNALVNVDQKYILKFRLDTNP